MKKVAWDDIHVGDLVLLEAYVNRYKTKDQKLWVASGNLTALNVLAFMGADERDGFLEEADRMRREQLADSTSVELKYVVDPSSL